MYVNNNNVDLPLIGPILPHSDPWCPIEKYIWNFKRQNIRICSAELNGIDQTLLLYGVKILWEDIESVLVEQGACLDLRPLLAGEEGMSAGDNENPRWAKIYGCSEVSINRCINALLNCLSQVVIVELDPSFFTSAKNEIKCGFLRVLNRIYILEARFFGGGGGKKNSSLWANELQFIKSVRKIQPQDSKELLCGKKDGKINRIQRETGVEISLVDQVELRNGGYYWIQVKPNMDTSTFIGLKQAFEEMEKEFPAELTFHMDEFHHKRLIGAGGSTIQKVMKQYGVYVRFLCYSESQSVLGREHVQFPGAPIDNVIIRTPQRNRFALDQMKRHLFNMVGDDEAFSLTTTPIDKYSNYNIVQKREPNTLYWVFREGTRLFLKQIRKPNKISKTILNRESPSDSKAEPLQSKPIEYNFATEFDSILEEIPRDLNLIGKGESESPSLNIDKHLDEDAIMDELKPITAQLEKNASGYIPFEWLLEDPLVHFRPRSQSLLFPLSPEENGEDLQQRRTTI